MKNIFSIVILYVLLFTKGVLANPIGYLIPSSIAKGDPDGVTICLKEGSSFNQYIQDYFNKKNWSYDTLYIIGSEIDSFKKLTGGFCDLYTNTVSELESLRNSYNQQDRLTVIQISENKKPKSEVIQTTIDKKSLKEELQYWKELFEDELITQAEYDAKRKELLSGASVTTNIVNVEQPTTNSNQKKIDMEKAKLEEMKKQTELAKKNLEEQKKIAAEAKAQSEELDYQRRMQLLQKGTEGLKKLFEPNHIGSGNSGSNKVCMYNPEENGRRTCHRVHLTTGECLWWGGFC